MTPENNIDNVERDRQIILESICRSVDTAIDTSPDVGLYPITTCDKTPLGPRVIDSIQEAVSFLGKDMVFDSDGTFIGFSGTTMTLRRPTEEIKLWDGSVAIGNIHIRQISPDTLQHYPIVEHMIFFRTAEGKLHINREIYTDDEIEIAQYSASRELEKKLGLNQPTYQELQALDVLLKEKIESIEISSEHQQIEKKIRLLGKLVNKLPFRKTR
ncbi:MAG: hypothetical protein NVSMB46_01970 [Candidatus Saccharimonadales bacterium]